MILLDPNKLVKKNQFSTFLSSGRKTSGFLIFSLFFSLFFFFNIPSAFAQLGGGNRSTFTFEDLKGGSSQAGFSVATLTPEEIEKAKQRLKNRPDLQNQVDPKIQKSLETTLKAAPKKKPEPAASDKNKTLPALKQRLVNQKKGLSPFKSYLRVKTPSTISLDIKPFGYDLFQKPRTAFKHINLLPVGPDYLLGPGDELRITVWGKINADHVIAIDRDGKIVLPQLGTLQVAGLTFLELKSFLKKELSRYYKASEVKMNVSMGQLRSIQVLVVGKVQQPGSYTLSSFASLIHALFAAGGPNKVGTMRDIQIRRQGKIITRFDFYDLLLRGDKGKDIRLMPEDVIFIPTVGPRIGIAGNVKAPAVYESKGGLTLRKLIEMAGGVSATGYLQRIQLERVFDNVSKIVLDLDFKELTEKENIPLLDGDLVKIFSIDPVITNAVTLKGNVSRPGTYAWQKGMRVAELFRDPDIFLKDTFLDYLLIERVVPPDYHKELLSVGLKDLLIEGNEQENILLEPHDTLVVFNRWDLKEKKTVQLSGAVNRPGRYEHRPGMTLSDLFKLAGGLKRPDHPESYLSSGMIVRRMPPDFHEEKLSFDFRRAIIAEDEAADLGLKPLDEVKIFDQWTLAQEKTVQVAGAVNRPGSYGLSENMRIRDFLNLAGGTQHQAFLKSAELTRITPTPDGPQIERFDINLEKAIAGDPESNKLLQRDDYLVIRNVPEWTLYRTVKITGEVRFPGNYTSKKGERLSSLIERAGGFTENAYLKGAQFSRKSIRLLQQRQLDDAIDRLEQQLLSKSANTIEASLSLEVAAQQKASMGQRRALIAKMRSAKAKGRLTIRLAVLEEFKDTPSNILLEEGDVLTIPEHPQQIQVIGAVFNQTAFIYDQESTVSQYMEKAGGMTDDADKAALYVLKVDGTAVSARQTKGFWRRSLLASQLDPGDTIVIPEKLEKIAWLREVKDMTQILYQVAVTAGVLIVAF